MDFIFSLIKYGSLEFSSLGSMCAVNILKSKLEYWGYV